MRKLTIIVIAALISVFSWAQEQVFNLEEAVQYAIQNSPQKTLDALAIEKADQEIKEYKSLGFPDISAGVDYQYYINLPVSLLPAEFFGGMEGTFVAFPFGTTQNLKANATLNQLIFDGSFFTGLKAQRLYRELTKKQGNQTEYDIRNNVTKAYLNVIMANENIQIIQNNIENLESTMNETKALLENGFAEKLDLQRLELSLDDLANSKSTLERVLKINKNLLKYQMNYPLDQAIETTQTVDDMYDKILALETEFDGDVEYANRPEYEQIQLGQELNEMQLQVKKNERLPKLYGFAQHTENLQRNELFNEDEVGFTNATVVGASLSVPIYSGGRRNAAIQKARIAIEETNIQKREFERGMELQVQNLHDAYITAKKNMFIAKRRESLALDIYDITKIKYENGVGSSLERTQAERDLYAAQSQYMNALFEMIVAKVDLDIALGQLDEMKY